MNIDGSILSSSGDIEEDKTIAAIASSLWTSYHKTGIHISEKNKLNCLIVDCEVRKKRMKEYFKFNISLS